MTDEYSGRNGPYQTLGINQRNGLQIGIKQNEKFDNCLEKDVVRAIVSIFVFLPYLLHVANAYALED